MSGPVRTEIDIEVRYVETDQMGVVHHSTYATWFEVARTRLCEQSGYHYAAIEKLGYHLVTSALSVNYRRPARYGETVQVTCWIDHLPSRAVHFAYEVHRDDELLATGITAHLWVEAATNRPCRTPEVLREGFRRLAGLIE